MSVQLCDPKETETGQLEKTKMTKQNWEKTMLAQKLKASSTVDVPSVEEGNTQFLRYLDAVYSTSKKLEEEVAAATNTKKEIKALVATLASTTRGLIKWGRLSGRVEPKQMISKTTQTGKEEYEGKEGNVANSPDLTKSQMAAIVQCVKDSLKETLDVHTETITKLAVATESLQLQHKKFVEEHQQQNQQQRRTQQRSTMGQGNIPQKKIKKRIEPGEGNQHTDRKSGENPNSTQIESQGQHQHQEDDTHSGEGELEDAKDDEGFTVVNKKKAYKKQPKRGEALTDDRSRKTPRAPKNQAIVINRPSGKKSYADTVREVKEVVERENLTYDIITRRAKSGNIILEIPEKEHADHLAEVLKTRMGEAAGVRRPSPSIPLIFIGIEDSIDEVELKRALVELDGDLKDASDFTIREGRTGIRTAIIRVPLKAGTKLIHTKRIKVGWAYCRIKEFDVREQACNKCREKGHVTRECTGPEKRKCFRCREIGHMIANCNKPNGRGGLKPNPGEQQSTAAQAEENLPQNDH